MSSKFESASGANRGKYNEMSRLLEIAAASRAFGVVASGCMLLVSTSGLASVNAEADFNSHIRPILKEYCWDCHAEGMSKGGIAFDEIDSDSKLLDHGLWMKVLKNTRANLMPPAKKPRPGADEERKLENWIKYEAFGIDPRNIDPGRVTVRRLNRVEYRNTIRALLNIDFRAEVEFPPDDTGYGFDNIGDVLSTSPLLIEKYIDAARQVVAEALPGVLDHAAAGPNKHAGENEIARKLASGVPASEARRHELSKALLSDFASRAFRRPVDPETLDGIVQVAENYAKRPGQSFQSGIAEGLIAILSSPRFLFRIEQPAAAAAQANGFFDIDEYSLASRLSYFLWSSMPDTELFQLAAKNKLRSKLEPQVRRMLRDRRSQQFIKNFTGQWLQTRDVAGIAINERTVLVRDNGGEKDFEKIREQLHALKEKEAAEGGLSHTNEVLRIELRERLHKLATVDLELDEPLRQAMQLETQLCVSNVFMSDHDVCELLDASYTFVNERLAKFYGLTNEITGSEMRRVDLPAGSVRGGVLTDAGVLLVTSNPDRTSPVKRGLFVLENVLNTPTPPPPANVPLLDAAEAKFTDHEPTLRESLEQHRNRAECMGCHSRMDPIGLGFENFNALGLWREKERGQQIIPAGKLITGETFTNVTELKHILAANHKKDFYRCLTEKMFTYALGRGMEYYDVETMDRAVARLDESGGKVSALVMAIVESAPFQRQRTKAIIATN
jgi:hypothetical protein